MIRAAYWIRDWGSDYDDEDGPARKQVAQDDSRANAWCSRVEHPQGSGLGNWHMPVIDVDVERTKEVDIAVYRLFPDCKWVPSTSHWHVYSDTPIRWTDYTDRLKVLVEDGIVEEGYYRAGLSRGATYVRMPHVKKVSDVGAE